MNNFRLRYEWMEWQMAMTTKQDERYMCTTMARATMLFIPSICFSMGGVGQNHQTTECGMAHLIDTVPIFL